MMTIIELNVRIDAKRNYHIIKLIRHTHTHTTHSLIVNVLNNEHSGGGDGGGCHPEYY